MTTVTCHTEGCANAGIPLDVSLSWTDDAGDAHTVTEVICGPCGNPITDIADEQGMRAHDEPDRTG